MSEGKSAPALCNIIVMSISTLIRAVWYPRSCFREMSTSGQSDNRKDRSSKCNLYSAPISAENVQEEVNTAQRHRKVILYGRWYARDAPSRSTRGDTNLMLVYLFCEDAPKYFLFQPRYLNEQWRCLRQSNPRSILPQLAWPSLRVTQCAKS